MSRFDRHPALHIFARRTCCVSTLLPAARAAAAVAAVVSIRSCVTYGERPPLLGSWPSRAPCSTGRPIPIQDPLSRWWWCRPAVVVVSVGERKKVCGASLQATGKRTGPWARVEACTCQRRRFAGGENSASCCCCAAVAAVAAVAFKSH